MLDRLTTNNITLLFIYELCIRTIGPVQQSSIIPTTRYSLKLFFGIDTRRQGNAMRRQTLLRENSRFHSYFAGCVQCRRRWIYGTAVFLGIFSVLCWLFPIAEFLDYCLVVDTPLESADAAVVTTTGGVLNEAVRLHREGYAACIIINCRVPEEYKNVDVPVTPCHFIREDLEKAGVPEESILHFDSGTTDWVGSQLAFRRFLKEHGIRSYILQPVRLHTRMTAMIHADTFPEGDMRLVMDATDGRLVLRKEILGIHNTFIRMAYWRFVHRSRMREALAQEKEGRMEEK